MLHVDVAELICMHCKIATLRCVNKYLYLGINAAYVASCKIQICWRRHAKRVIGRQIVFTTRGGLKLIGIVVSQHDRLLKLRRIRTNKRKHFFFIAPCDFKDGAGFISEAHLDQ